MHDHKPEPDVPTSRIMRRDAPKMTPEALRPKTQLSITEFADTENEEPLEVSRAVVAGNGKKDGDEGLTEGHDNGNANESGDKWRLPVLDGRDEDTENSN